MLIQKTDKDTSKEKNIDQLFWWTQMKKNLILVNKINTTWKRSYILTSWFH
jgi:hypothetical protein